MEGWGGSGLVKFSAGLSSVTSFTICQLYVRENLLTYPLVGICVPIRMHLTCVSFRNRNIPDIPTTRMIEGNCTNSVSYKE